MTQAKQEWRPVRGFRGWYEVSNDGQVRRVRPGNGTQENRVLSPRSNQAVQYQQVFLSREGTVHMRYVHILVAEAFHGRRPGVIYRVNHKDRDRTNNHVDNLEWVTASENTRLAMNSQKPTKLTGSMKRAWKYKRHAR